jgi:hypothetical protein
VNLSVSDVLIVGADGEKEGMILPEAVTDNPNPGVYSHRLPRRTLYKND